MSLMIPTDFLNLYETAKQFILLHPESDQVVVLESAAGQIHTIVNTAIRSGDLQAENQFLQQLAHHQDSHILRLVAMWHNQSVERPSQHLLCGLTGIDTRNDNTRILTWGSGGYHIRTVQDVR